MFFCVGEGEILIEGIVGILNSYGFEVVLGVKCESFRY